MIASLKRLLVGFCFVLAFATSAAPARDLPGTPYSDERRTYCQAQKAPCLQRNRRACYGFPNGPSYNACLGEAEQVCEKAFNACLSDGEPEATPTTTPVPPPTEMGAQPSPCNAFIAQMLAYVQENPLHRVHVVWTTNYFANGTRYAGVTDLMLRAHGLRALIGEGQRQRTPYGGHHVPVEPVSLLVRWDAKVSFNGIYGPYPITCSANKFAVAYTGDSVETFNFKFPPH